MGGVGAGEEEERRTACKFEIKIKSNQINSSTGPAAPRAAREGGGAENERRRTRYTAYEKIGIFSCLLRGQEISDIGGIGGT